MNRFIRHLHSIHPLSEGLSAHLKRIIKKEVVLKKGLLLRTGEVCKNIYFIEKGLLRCYYRRGSKEISTCFIREGEICISAESFLLQKSSYENIQALEDTVVYSISYEELEDICRKLPSFNFFGRTLAEKYFLQLNQQLYAMRMQPAQARYSWMLEKFPGLILRVPLKYIASYLGMTDVMLSKIRSRKCA